MNSKPSFKERVEDLKQNKKEVFAKMENQAEDQSTKEYYQNKDNTLILEVDNEIID